MKNKNKYRKKRKDVLSFRTAGIVDKLTVTHYDDGSIELHGGDEISGCFHRSYERTSGKQKTTLRMEGGGKRLYWDDEDYFRATFDYMVAVDTGYKTINGHLIAVTTVYVVPGPLAEFAEDIPYVPLVGYLIVDLKRRVNPERIGWHLAMINNIQTAEFSSSRRVALVVDSELGAHSNINSREEPYYNNFLLPANVSLVYASDSTSDSLPNQMLKYCDMACRKILQELNANIQLPSPKNGDKNFAGYCYLWLNGEHKRSINKPA